MRENNERKNKWAMQMQTQMKMQIGRKCRMQCRSRVRVQSAGPGVNAAVLARMDGQ